MKSKRLHFSSSESSTSNNDLIKNLTKINFSKPSDNTLDFENNQSMINDGNPLFGPLNAKKVLTSVNEATEILVDMSKSVSQKNRKKKILNDDESSSSEEEEDDDDDDDEEEEEGEIDDIVPNSIILASEKEKEIKMEIWKVTSEKKMFVYMARETEKQNKMLLKERNDKIKEMENEIERIIREREVYRRFFYAQVYGNGDDVIYNVFMSRNKNKSSVLKNVLKSCYNLDMYVSRCVHGGLVDKNEKLFFNESSCNEFKMIMRNQFIPSFEAVIFHGFKEGLSMFQAMNSTNYFSVLLGKMNEFERLNLKDEHDLIFTSFICKMLNDKLISKFFNWIIENDEHLKKYYSANSILCCEDSTKSIYKRIKRISKLHFHLHEDCNSEGELLDVQKKKTLFKK